MVKKAKPPHKPKGKLPVSAPKPMANLGRGLSDIISQGAKAVAAPSFTPPIPVSGGTQVRQLPLSSIHPNPKQPRLRFVEEPLEELSSSIKEHGVLQPITVRAQGDRYEIIAGERRFRASQKAGLSTIPAIVKNVSDVEAYELALIENLQREDLDAIEEARGYQRLANEFNLTQEQIAQKVGKNRATVANSTRLLDLPEEIQSFVSQKLLTAGHAKAILGIPSAELQVRTAHDVIKQGLNVRQTELLISKRKEAATPRKTNNGSTNPKDIPAHYRAIQDAIQQKFGTKVLIHPVGNGGKIEIQYYAPVDLERILQILQIQL